MQGATLEELQKNLCEVVEGCLAVDVGPVREPGKGRALEIDV